MVPVSFSKKFFFLLKSILVEWVAHASQLFEHEHSDNGNDPEKTKNTEETLAVIMYYKKVKNAMQGDCCE